MIRRTGFAVPFGLGLFLGLAVPASGQEGVEAGAAPSGEEAKAPAAEVDTRVEVTGNRYRFKLKTGSVIEGVLPRGLHWERLDQYGDFVEAKEKERGSGLRVQYVLNMEGDIFIKREDIAVKEDGKLDLRDLGALTEEEKLAIRQRVQDDRRKVIVAREKALAEEIARLTGKKEGEKEGEESGQGEEAEEEGGEKGPDAETIKKGEALLEKFPPEEWSKKRLEDILRREVINGIYRNDEEREFIDNFNLWKDALERREAKKKEEEKKGGAGTSGGGAGSGGSAR